MSTDWADRIRALEDKGWSLRAIGDVIDLSPQSLSDIKNGRTKAPVGMAAVQLFQLHARECLPPPANDDTFTPDTDQPAAAPAAGEG